MTTHQFNSDVSSVTNLEKPNIPSTIPPNINPSISDVMSGEVDFFKLPPEQRQEIESTYYSEYATDSDKEAWDKNGWRPQPMFKGLNRDGQPIDWVDSSTFLERGRKKPPSSIRENSQQVELNRTLEEINRKIEQINEYNRKKEEQEYSQLNNSLDFQIKKAKDEMDVERLEILYEQKYKSRPTSVPVETPKPTNESTPQGFDPVIAEWAKQSDWFDKDKELTEWALGYFQENLVGNGRSIFQNLRELDEKAFNQQNDKPIVSMVEKPTNYGFGNTNTAPSIKGSVKRYEDLPASARQWYESAINSGKMTRESAVKNYNNELPFQEQLRKNKERKGW